MKYFKFISSLILTTILIFFLNTKVGIIPPIGKFLNPFMGFWQNAEKTDGWQDQTLQLNGVKDKVQIYFDERLVPHVFAKNDEDLYFTQGYITAKYRLWQMEVSTHSAAGRVSEIVGEKALENDKMMRRIGMGYGAEAAQKFIEQDTATSKLVHAYCDGINAYINSLNKKDYPIEYKLLDYSPEKWEPIKVALLLKNMANMLSVYEYDIENANFVATYGMDAFRQLYPDFITDEDPIIPAGTDWQANKASDEETQSEQLSSSETYRNIIPKPDEINGSNNWAVSGSKTKSGKPILCNDPHLRLSLPSIWFEMHLVSPNMNVYGATLPGSPAVIIGFNDSISWGVTNGGRDVRDWYKIKFKDDSREEYEWNGQWLKSEKKIEKYVVRGKGEVYDTVIYTRYGPVVFDKNFGTADSKKNLAMSWAAHLPSNEFKTFYGFNCGKNYDDYIAALNYYNCPAQNFVFASRSGDIAIKEQGKFPIRDKTTEQGKYLSDGTTDKDDWKEFIPFDANPMVKNPERGFVSSANQHPTDSTYPYYYPGVGVYETYRNRRINKLLSEGNMIDVAFMKKMQNDNYNLHAQETAPVLLSLLDLSALSEEEKHIAEVIKQWDYYNNPQEVAPVYFEIWWNELRKMLWDEMLNPALPMKQPNFYATTYFLRTDSASQFYDNLSTADVKESRRDIILNSFHRIKDTIQSKQFTEVSEPYESDETYEKKDLNPHDWGTYKDTRISHLAMIAPFSAKAYNGGNLGIINATNSTHGPSWRMIVDEGSMKGYVVYPGGQSGNPGSVFYDNMVKAWADGNYYEANFTTNTEVLLKKKLFITTINPR